LGNYDPEVSDKLTSQAFRDYFRATVIRSELQKAVGNPVTPRSELWFPHLTRRKAELCQSQAGQKDRRWNPQAGTFPKGTAARQSEKA
jgi:hypothetical protein